MFQIISLFMYKYLERQVGIIRLNETLEFSHLYNFGSTIKLW